LARGSRDGTIIPAIVDTRWGTDLTMPLAGEGLASVFIAVNGCSAECAASMQRRGPRTPKPLS
jgi:hypothetical protein